MYYFSRKNAKDLLEKRINGNINANVFIFKMEFQTLSILFRGFHGTAILTIFDNNTDVGNRPVCEFKKGYNYSIKYYYYNTVFL